MAARWRAFGMALGLIGFASGVGVLVDGSVLPGLGLIAAGLVLGGIPLAGFVASLRAGRTPVDSSALDRDPTLRAGFRRHGRLVAASSVLPFLAAAALFAVLVRSAAGQGFSAGTMVAVSILSAFLAGIPALMGARLVAAGMRLAAGDTFGAVLAIFLNRIALVLAVLVGAGTISDRGLALTAVLSLAVLVAVGCLLVNGLLRRLLRTVEARIGVKPGDVGHAQPEPSVTTGAPGRIRTPD